MTVRSFRFLSSSAVPTGSSGSLYLVGSGQTALAKYWTVHNHSGVATDATLQLWTSSTSKRTLAKVALAVDEAAQLELWVVALPGNEYHVIRNSAGAVSTTLSGALLDGLAS